MRTLLLKRLCLVYVVFQFYSWFKFYFPLFKLIIIHYNTQKQKKIKFLTKDKIEPQHIHVAASGEGSGKVSNLFKSM